MNRRDFLTTSALLGFTATTMLQACENTKNSKDPSGNITLYYEIRVAKPELKEIKKLLKEKKKTLASYGLLNFSMKQMVGDSTMVKNYPESYKGILATAYKDGADENTLPLFYSLFFRFDSYASMKKSNIQAWFKDVFAKHLKAKKMPIIMQYYEGVFQTVLAGDMNGIYKTQEEINSYLKRGVEGTITVANHVSISNDNLDKFEEQVKSLLKVAQTTYQPESNKDNGLDGAKDNNYYHIGADTFNV